LEISGDRVSTGNNMEEEVPHRRAGIRGFFGLESREKALETFVWTLPYLGIVVVSLVSLSWLVQKLNPMPLWVYTLAIVLAILYFFFFLARVRQMGLESHEPSEKGPQQPQ
jgi:hypothetical protein